MAVMSSSRSLHARHRTWTRRLTDALSEQSSTSVRGQLWVTGSVGRFEAMPGSDLETIAVSGGEESARRVRAEMSGINLGTHPLYAESSPISAADRRFTMTGEHWRDAAVQWARNPAENLGVVQLGLLVDSRPLSPVKDSSPSNTLLPDLAISACSQHTGVLDEILHDTLSTESYYPNRIRAVVRNDIQFSIKHRIVVPAVKIARWTSIRLGVLGSTCRTTSTIERFYAAERRGGLELRDVQWASLADAFSESMGILWDVRARGNDPHLESGSPTGEPVMLSSLSVSERTILKESAREVAGAQRQLRFLADSGFLKSSELT